MRRQVADLLMPHHIRAARTAQHLAVRALTAPAWHTRSPSRSWRPPPRRPPGRGTGATPCTRSTPHRRAAVPADLYSRYTEAHQFTHLRTKGAS